MSAMALNLKRIAKAIFSAIYMDKMWAENMISQPIFYLCQQVRNIDVTGADGATADLGNSTLDPVNDLVMTFDLPAWSFSKDETYTITIGA